MHRIVYLERATLRARVRRPAFPHEWTEHAVTDAHQVAERIRAATIVVSNKAPLTRSELAAAPGLQLIAIAATGANHIDLEYCRGRRIVVCNVREYSQQTLPEHAFMLMLALRRNLPAYRADVAAGRWAASPQFSLYSHRIRDLHGATLGVIGSGMIGTAVARLARALDMRVLRAERKGAAAVRSGYAPFDKVLREADVLTLHCPLTRETRHLIGAGELAAMKRDAILINTARGALVDERALAAALAEGRIGGAGIDVLSEEPPVSGNPLLDLDLPNLIVTPHVAWASDEAQQRLADGLIDNIEAFARGAPQNVLG